MAKGTASQPPQLIDLAPPGIDPNTPQSLAFQPTGQNDLSPCTINAYSADRFVLLSAFAPTPFTITNAADPKNTAQNLETSLTNLQAARISPRGAVQVAIPAYAAALPSDFGILYLDQLRIRPAGTVIGENVYTLALGPLEKVTLTQTTYTKKTVSVDSLTDSTQETDQEFSSSFSNELASNIQNEVQSQSQQKLSVDGKVGFGPVSLGGGYSATSSQGSRNTQSKSIKQSQQTTQKVSTKAKMEHRIEFKTETETGVEDVAQRVFQNPNTAHTLMLNFFKVLQRYEVYLERYGATLCWAPCLMDPGKIFRQPWTDKIAQKLIALNNVPQWVPDDLKLAPAPVAGVSAWVYVPMYLLTQTPETFGVDNLAKDNNLFTRGLNMQTQIAVPAGYELASLDGGHAVLPVGWGGNLSPEVDLSSIQPGPLACEVKTNFEKIGPLPGGLLSNLPAGTQPNWAVAVTGPNVGNFTSNNGKGTSALVADGGVPFGQAPLGGQAGQNITWSDIPGDSSVNAPSSAAGSSSSTPVSSSGGGGTPASEIGETSVSWYVAIPLNEDHADWSPYFAKTFPVIALRTWYYAVPSDATISAYNASLLARRQTEYQARLSDLQETIAAAQAALADGASFDPVQEICRQLMGKALAPTTVDDRTCAYLETWRDAFAWESVAYVMTAGWMNPLLDFYNPLPVQQPGGGLPVAQAPVALSSLLAVLSGNQSSTSSQGGASFPYAASFPPLWGNQPTMFTTAASVQAFIPINPGFEVIAARLIAGNTNFDVAVQSLANDLSTFQQQNFGTVVQPPVGQPLVVENPTVLQLASWQEIMPTDGTYVDALLGDCLAADTYLIQQLQAQTALKTSQASMLAAQTGASTSSSGTPRQPPARATS